MSKDQQNAQTLSSEVLSRLTQERRKFLAFLERRVGSRETAEDILQSAFARGIEQGSNASDEDVVRWFYRVLRNAVIDHYRRHAASERAMESLGREFTDVQQPEVELRKEICQCVSGLLVHLKPEYRNALQVVDLEDGKLADLAQRSGISPENAAVRIHRARKALRRQVELTCGACAEHGCTDCDCRQRR